MNRNGGGEFPGGGNYARKQGLFYRKNAGKQYS